MGGGSSGWVREELWYYFDVFPFFCSQSEMFVPDTCHCASSHHLCYGHFTLQSFILQMHSPYCQELFLSLHKFINCQSFYLFIERFQCDLSTA